MAQTQKGRTACSLADFDEENPRAFINSPRSLQACRSEGVLPQELVFKPIEAFQEKNLSPRLVKLRYDFFEAKRRDLLAAARRARESLVSDDKHKESSNNELAMISKQSGLSTGAVLALQSDGLKQERKKLQKAQEIERNWLKNQLTNELNALKRLETNDIKLTEADNSNAEKMRLEAKRLKDMNDKRAQEEERKQMENEARQKLEKQIAKEEFHKQQEELKRKAEEDARKEREAYLRQVEAAEKKKEAERKKAEERERQYQIQESKKAEMRAQDLRRMDLLDQQKNQFQLEMAKKKEDRDLRIYKSIETNMELEAKRKEDYEEKCRQEAIREERMAQARALEQEEGAKRAFQTMMKRKVIAQDAARKAEERRQAILDNQEETEFRLLEHEQKKERYLDFKRELDGLRLKNKEINVERQRRREEASREQVAEQVRKKDEKISAMNEERKRLWQIRRTAQSEAYRARELIKTEIMRQRIASKFNSNVLENKLNDLMDQDIFHPRVLQTSASAPQLKAKRLSEQQR